LKLLFWAVGDGVTLLVCTGIFVSLMTTILDTSWYGIIWTTKSNQIIEQDLISNNQQIVFFYCALVLRFCTSKSFDFKKIRWGFLAFLFEITF
jgi:hypothetical protein